MKKETYKIEGMHCASCVATIERVLRKTEGVESASVNFASESALIEFDEKIVSESELAKAVEGAGYNLNINSLRKEEVMKMPEMDMNSPEHDHMKMEREEQIKEMKWKLVIGGALSLLIFLGSFPQWFSFIPKILNNNWVLLLLTTPVQFWVGWQFYSGLKLLFKYRTADMNTLIVIGTLAAYFYSVAVTIFSDFFSKGGITPQLYFDTSAIIIVLILLGKYFEVLMKGRASEAIKKLIGLQPKTAKILRGGKEVEIPIAEVVVGDLIIVRPGERIPVDGKIVEGDSEIDESMITGESMPVHKKVDSLVIGSTINKFGTLTFRATKIGKDTMLSQIIKMVEEAQGSKAPIQRLADLVSSYFVPAVFVVAVLTFVVWIFFGSASPSLGGPSPAFTFALVNFVAVLIIACPCALGLATPMAIMVSSGSAATLGILIKDAASLEIANKINAVILDKTGTLTEGKPQLTDILAFGDEHKVDILNFAASLEQRSEHPLAQAILQYAASLDQKSSHPLDQTIIDEAAREKIVLYKLEDFKAISGKGLKGFLQIQSEKVEAHLGNRALVADLGLNISPFEENIAKLENEGKTVMILVVGKKLKGALAVADVLKKESVEAVNALKEKNIDVWMLTGDNSRTASAIAKEAGIENIMSEVLPDKKSEKVRELQEQGKIVAMIGDGINDAPALTQANVGIAMGEGTDIAMESANITLMRGDLMLIPEVIKISRRTMRIIKQNLFWAFFYNIAFIPVAAGVLYPFFKLLLNPIFAAIAMAFSSISVVLNSLRLKRN
ncbi:heavy metal translocating P-type ATPase [Candidatus Nomurabacteria bacterium]|nr:heavy metal translocating P-type ATPase [Candidatus Nomurabacteria bacterium]